jgi:hypothetical protein
MSKQEVQVSQMKVKVSFEAPEMIQIQPVVYSV